MSTIRPDELDVRLGDDDLFVLDVRPVESYATSHIDGSENVPVYDALRRGEAAALDRVVEAVPPDAEVAVVCKLGVVARRATEHLQAEGHEARTLRGGMSGWLGYQRGSVLYRLRSLWWRLRG